MAVKVKRHKSEWNDPTGVLIDGQKVKIEVRRISLQQQSEFKIGFATFISQGRRGVPIRKAGEEGLTDDQVWERRLMYAPESDDAQRERERVKRTHTEVIEFWQHSITNYVRVVEGELVDEDTGDSIVNGADLWEVITDDETAIGHCIMAIWFAITLTDDVKKKLPPLPDLLGSSHASPSAPNGAAPASTATSAESSGSAPSGDATGEPASVLSGSAVA